MAHHFVTKYAQKSGKSIQGVSSRALEALRTYPWPGNVRELENIIERGIILNQGRELEAGEWLPKPLAFSLPSSRITTLEDREREHILKALQHTGWKVSGNGGAAMLLGLKPTTLEARMKRASAFTGLPLKDPHSNTKVDVRSCEHLPGCGWPRRKSCRVRDSHTPLAVENLALESFPDFWIHSNASSIRRFNSARFSLKR